MVWRGSSTPLDRLWVFLVYLLPLVEATLGFSQPFFSMFPQLQFLLLPLAPFIWIYSLVLGIFSFGGLGIGGLIIFFGLFFLVVRNPRVSHFVRFNAMQAILIGIVLSIISLIWSLILAPIASGGLIEDTIFNTVFLGAVAIVIYAIVQSVRGLYAEIPMLSEAAYAYTRY